MLAAAPPRARMNSRRFIRSLVGAGEQRGGNVEAKRLGGLEINDEFKLRGPIDWQVTRSVALRMRPT